MGAPACALGRGQRRLPPRHPREALRRGTADDPGPARRHLDPLEVQRVERRPERPDAAVDDGATG